MGRECRAVWVQNSVVAARSAADRCVYKKPGVRLHLKNAVPNSECGGRGQHCPAFHRRPGEAVFLHHNRSLARRRHRSMAETAGRGILHVCDCILDQVAGHMNAAALAQGVAKSKGKVKDFKVDPGSVGSAGLLGAFTYSL